MSSSSKGPRRPGLRRRARLFGATALVACAGIGVQAAAAQADPFHLDINNAILDLGSIEGVRAIDSTATPPDPAATLDGDITGNAFTVPVDGFVFPEKVAEVATGINATINMTVNEPITGTFDSATGLLTANASIKATVEVLGSECIIDPVVVSLSTANTEPYPGVPFTAGLDGPGAFVDGWAALPPVQGGGACTIVGQLTAGPGGIWMSQDIQDPPPLECPPVCPPDPADLGISVTPKQRVAKPGGKATFVARLRNTGGEAAAGTKVCVQAPKTLKGARCKTVGSLAGAGSVTRAIVLTPTKKVAGKKFTLRFTASATGTPSKTATAKLTVKKKKKKPRRRRGR